MFYLTNALFIGSLFGILMAAELDMSVCPGVRVEDPDVKKYPFKSTTPESASRDVGACTILGGI